MVSSLVVTPSVIMMTADSAEPRYWSITWRKAVPSRLSRPSASKFATAFWARSSSLGIDFVGHLADRAVGIRQLDGPAFQVQVVNVNFGAALIQQVAEPILIGLGDERLGQLQARRPPGAGV